MRWLDGIIDSMDVMRQTCALSVPPRKATAVPGEGRGAAFMLADGFQVVPVVKKPPANAGDLRDEGLIPGLGMHFTLAFL